MRTTAGRAVLLIAIVLSPGPAELAAAPHLDYSSYLGGTGSDSSSGVAVDSSGCVYVAGYTDSSDFPVLNAYQPSRAGNRDIFVCKFSSAGNILLYSTYLGGSQDDCAYGIVVDALDRPVVTGDTQSADFPVTPGTWQTVFGGGTVDAVVVRLAADGGSLGFSTFLGGNGIEQARGVAIDASGFIYVTGYTKSTNFPTHSPLQASFGGGDWDAFVTQFYTAGDLLYYSTYLGGSGSDQAWGIAVDGDYCAYVTGETTSASFPTANAFQPAMHSAPASSAFVSKLSSAGTSLEYSTYLGGSGYGSSAQAIALDSSKQAYVTGYTAAPDFPTSNPFQADNHSWPSGTDAFVASFSPAGNALVFSTYLGGNGNDIGYGIAVDPFYGDSHICGYSISSDFPLEAPFQNQRQGAQDAFYTHLNAAGDRLYYSTYLGGSGDWDVAYAIAFKDRPDERVWLSGETDSADFPLQRVCQASYGGGTVDAFLAGFSWGGTPAANRYHTDFNGDGTSDIAIFRPSSGLWAVRGITRAYFGTSSDSPVPGDYNGDETTDIGIFRESSGLWAVNGVTRTYFGGISDLPVPGDYEGNGTAGVAIYRSSSGLWAIRGVTRAYFGGSADSAVPGYYGPEGKKTIGIFRPASGLWALKGVTRTYFGGPSDSPVPGDYEGNGSWDPGIFRAASGLWAVKGLTRAYFGGSADSPIPGGYRGDGTDCLGIFRGTSGLWAIKVVTRTYFGSGSDVPVTR